MSDTGAAITRRDLVLGAGSLAAIGLLGLAGCEGTDPKGGTDAKESTDLRGKRLYFKSTYRYASNGLKDGDLCTFTFDDDDDSWHYAGPNEYGGTWTMEGENVILALATGPAMGARPFRCPTTPAGRWHAMGRADPVRTGPGWETEAGAPVRAPIARLLPQPPS